MHPCTSALGLLEGTQLTITITITPSSHGYCSFLRTGQTSCLNKFTNRRASRAAAMMLSHRRVCTSPVDRKEFPERLKVLVVVVFFNFVCQTAKITIKLVRGLKSAFTSLLI